MVTARSDNNSNDNYKLTSCNHVCSMPDVSNNTMSLEARGGAKDGTLQLA